MSNHEIPEGAALGRNGTIYYNIAETYHHFEQGEALHMWLDDKQVPRIDVSGDVFSLVGRVMRLIEATNAPVPRAGGATNDKPDAWIVGLDVFKTFDEAERNVRNPDLKPEPLFRAARRQAIDAARSGITEDYCIDRAAATPGAAQGTEPPPPPKEPQ